jgi:hypothetical protein
MYDVLDPRDLLEGELDQCRESGRDIAPIEAAVQAALSGGSAADRRLMLRVLGDVRAASDWRYDEPSSLEAIAATLPRRRWALLVLPAATLCAIACWRRGAGAWPAASSESRSKAEDGPPSAPTSRRMTPIP